MKKILLAVVFAATAMPLLAVEVGDTYEKVVDERSLPVSKIELGSDLTLNYADSTIKLHEGKVSFIKMAGVETGDSFEKVVEKKGAPASRIAAGISIVLRYKDATIKLREDKVVSVKLAGAAEGITSSPSSATKQPHQPVQPMVGEGDWTTDYATALSQPNTDQKKILLFFTGSDWCGWCKRLDREVLSTSDFMLYARSNLILVKLDFPRSIAQSAG